MLTFPRNLGVIFNKSLKLSQHISAISKSYLHNIRYLRRIQSSACTIATSVIHSKFDYYSSFPFYSNKLSLTYSQFC